MVTGSSGSDQWVVDIFFTSQLSTPTLLVSVLFGRLIPTLCPILVSCFSFLFLLLYIFLKSHNGKNNN